MRQAFRAIDLLEAARQVDAVPRLLQRVVREVPLQLTLEDPAGGIGPHLRQGADVDDEMLAGPQGSLDGSLVPLFEQRAHPGLGPFEQARTQLASLKQVEVL